MRCGTSRDVRRFWVRTWPHQTHFKSLHQVAGVAEGNRAEAGARGGGYCTAVYLAREYSGSDPGDGWEVKVARSGLLLNIFLPFEKTDLINRLDMRHTEKGTKWLQGFEFSNYQNGWGRTYWQVRPVSDHMCNSWHIWSSGGVLD